MCDKKKKEKRETYLYTPEYVSGEYKLDVAYTRLRLPYYRCLYLHHIATFWGTICSLSKRVHPARVCTVYVIYPPSVFYCFAREVSVCRCCAAASWLFLGFSFDLLVVLVVLCSCSCSVLNVTLWQHTMMFALGSGVVAVCCCYFSINSGVSIDRNMFCCLYYYY